MTTKRNTATHIRIGRKAPASPASPASPTRPHPAPRLHAPPALAVRHGRARRRDAHRGGCPRRGPGTRRGAHQLRSHAQHLRLPGRDEHRRTQGTTLKSVPSQVSSGPGWHYNAAGNDVIVTVKGTVLSGLYIPHNLVIDAANVTVKDVQVVTNGNFGISLTHTTGATIENSTISGQNATTGRVNSAIDDVYGDSTGMVIKDNNISYFRTGVQISTGLVNGNYIHTPATSPEITPTASTSTGARSR